MFGQPPLSFVLQHREKLEYLPLHRTPDGDIAPQEYRSTCACGWHGRASTSRLVVGGDHQDHVQQAWLASQDED